MSTEPDDVTAEDDVQMPKSYKINRSCTDILFLILFVLVWLVFIAFGVIAFTEGRVMESVYGVDRNGYYCGGDEVPSGFPGEIPANASFQSRVWSENQYVWYPLPLKKSALTLNSVFYLRLGLCVRNCPFVNESLLKRFLENTSSVTQAELEAVRVYSYGGIVDAFEGVDSIPHMIPLFNTSNIMGRCVPTFHQPDIVMSHLITTDYGSKVYNFLLRCMFEVIASWRVFLCAGGVCVALCFFFFVLVQYLIYIVVWLFIVAIFGLLFGGGYCCFHLYQYDGSFGGYQLDLKGYGPFLLFTAVLLWVVSLVYVIFILNVCTKIQFACALVRVASCVVESAPTLVLVPVSVDVLIFFLLVWSAAVGLGLYNIQDSGKNITFAPIADTLAISNETAEMLYESDMYRVATEAIGHRFALVYILCAGLFTLLWSAAFLNAVSFTSISFVSTFWYFSSLSGEDKSVPNMGVLKAVLWTIFYHPGTLALGSLLIALIQLLQIILSYFAAKYKKAISNNDIMPCLLCYLKCILSCFESIIKNITKNIYVIMCITSKNFCCAAYTGSSLAVGNTAELMFVSTMITVVKFLGMLFVMAGCVVTSFYLLDNESLAPGVESKIAPLILIGLGAYFVCSPFFDVFSSCTVAILICYCHDLYVNEALGLFYVPVELENRLTDYSQKKKLRLLKHQQSSAHQDG